MMNTKKYGFSSADRNMIRKDWAALLPDMLPRPKTTLIKFYRMVGPLVICVNLNLDGGGTYQVGYYLHSFVIESNVLAIYLRTNPHTSLMFIKRDDHKQKYQESFKSLKENAWISLDGPITLDDIFNGYSNAARAQYTRSRANYDESLVALTKRFNGDVEKAKEKIELGTLEPYEAITPAFVAAWAGELKKAKEYLDWAYKVVRYDGDKMYIEGEKLIANPDLLRATAKAERIKHGLTYAPCQNIVGVPYQETWPD